ncbi:hypothetical protein IV203_012681 [Nitzschia inconspicua]|uniref:Uncharacterized protein n=1 Tax=Nitzschia inconspicua TaxID=303405 RepID=A0A9K3K492_9STRA|nr:hypothetical protein IV203_014268 [Nitzschia inconspicua]KAG7350084.1 hypothetical protein IV203_012681 [Nitzschia inconspicua]
MSQLDYDVQQKARMRHQVELWNKMRMWSLIFWKLFFAAIAFLDLASCWDTFYMGWTGESVITLNVCPIVVPSNASSSSSSNISTTTTTTTPNSSFLMNASSQGLRHSTCYAAYSILFQIRWITDTIRKQWIPVPLHGLFCVLCLVEMVLRAMEAHQLASRNQAIARFEESLSRVYSTTRMYAKQIRRGSWRMSSNNGLGDGHDDNNEIHPTLHHFQPHSTDTVAVSTTSTSSSQKRRISSIQDRLLARSTLRLWIPVGITCFFWLSMLPRTWEEYVSDAPLCGTDSAFATEWMTNTFTKFILTTNYYTEFIQDLLWGKFVMPYKMISQPRRFWKRLRQLLKIVKMIRFAGPVTRMSLKLCDQLYAMFKTRRQAWWARNEREKRMRRPSLLWRDLQQLEAITKVQTRLASLPSQLFELAQDHLPPGAAINGHRLLQQQKKQAHYIKRQLKNLQHELNKSISAFSNADLYDRMASLTQNVNIWNQRQSLSSSFWTFLQSPDFLISPRSRFSVVWRMTVTNCLSIELSRLAVSWYLTKTFRLSITQVITRLFIHCDHPKNRQKHLKFFTDQITNIHKALATSIPLIPMPEEKWIVCVPQSISANLFLNFGSMMETFIDIVSFMDIFFWFFTGDLDEMGFVVPKHFITRCIIPGTLVQILDHPTLPGVLPALIRRGLAATMAAGWSRTMRWIFAIGPAINLLFLQPLTRYFFRHFDDSWGMDGTQSDVLMKCAESMGYLPRVPTNRSLFVERESRHHRRTRSPSSISPLNLQRVLSTPLHAMPSMTRSTPSTFDDDYMYEDSIRFEDDDLGLAAPKSHPLSSTFHQSSGLSSSVRFSKDVAILDRLDSVDTVDYRSDESSHQHHDDSAFDIGYSISARDLQSLQEHCDD